MIRKKKATQTLKPRITPPPPFGLKDFENKSLEQRKLAPWQHLEHILQGVPPASVLSWDLDRMYLYTLCKS
ncbi:hypothetical protein NHP190012_11110 [Helicobacter sp. NHP19-012]|uniref:Uncharacterized protein n=1 Tax=Helicobacter gastrofelis TaxID=2849642 RepID=A0ABN6I9X3_9HELI|nr:hypothetical protein NHP190012_11110 [Helicobacter sp. NHP19-012]